MPRPPPGGHVFQPTRTMFELVQYIMGINLLTTFHDDRTINVNSRVKHAPAPGGQFFSTHRNHSQISVNKKNAPTKGGHVFQPTVTDFELVQDFTNLLTKFHEDRTINISSNVLTTKKLTPHDGQKTITGE
ncbi:hypothetical protein DPMN_081581 [Dreissena polymorpha]|uniref:Uncharacterized protein n=1 Tax=Dreissena polymorpha TaxID=45954 RepID=A0A9D3Y937_DREPO|nr:hypothetical protein DPMN_081581 [Dreissena polymorpha]